MSTSTPIKAVEGPQRVHAGFILAIMQADFAFVDVKARAWKTASFKSLLTLAEKTPVGVLLRRSIVNQIYAQCCCLSNSRRLGPRWVRRSHRDFLTVQFATSSHGFSTHSSICSQVWPLVRCSYPLGQTHTNEPEVLLHRRLAQGSPCRHSSMSAHPPGVPLPDHPSWHKHS